MGCVSECSIVSPPAASAPAPTPAISAGVRNLSREVAMAQPDPSRTGTQVGYAEVATAVAPDRAGPGAAGRLVLGGVVAWRLAGLGELCLPLVHAVARTQVVQVRRQPSSSARRRAAESVS